MKMYYYKMPDGICSNSVPITADGYEEITEAGYNALAAEIAAQAAQEAEAAITAEQSKDDEIAALKAQLAALQRENAALQTSQQRLTAQLNANGAII